MYNIPTKFDGVSTLPAAEFNSLATEVEAAVLSNNAALDSGSTTQLAQAISTIGTHATGYTDSGTANAKILTVTGGRANPTAMVGCMTISFVNLVTNTGATTVNVAGLGAVGLNSLAGTALQANMIMAGDYVVAMWDGASFLILNAKTNRELNNLISDVTTYNPSNPDQVAQAVAHYAAHSTEFACSGTTPSYVLTRRGTIQSASAYTIGEVIRFKASFTNVGNPTVNRDSNGAVSLRSAAGFLLPASYVKSGDWITAIYDGTYFLITSHSDKGFPALWQTVWCNTVQNILTTTVTQVDFNQFHSYSTVQWMDMATNRFTPQIAGNYLIMAGIRIATATDTTGNLDCYIRLNGSNLYSSSVLCYSLNNSWKSSLSHGVTYLNGTTDYIDIGTYQTTTVTRSTEGVVDTTFATFLRL